MSVNDCIHGNLIGTGSSCDKCDTERTIDELRADLARLRAELDAANKRAEELAKTMRRCKEQFAYMNESFLNLARPPYTGCDSEVASRLSEVSTTLAAYDAARKEPPHA